jgi:hypothetical protein
MTARRSSISLTREARSSGGEQRVLAWREGCVTLAEGYSVCLIFLKLFERVCSHGLFRKQLLSHQARGTSVATNWP